MRQKISFILLLLSLSATTLCAENTSTQQLVVWLKNGQKVVHDLADKPETRFNADPYETTIVSLSDLQQDIEIYINYE